MKVLLAKTAGFCFGVKRAVDTVYQQVEENKDCKIYTFGPIIHNDEVIKEYAGERCDCTGGRRRSSKGKERDCDHTIPRSTEKRICDRMDELGIQYVDATCPFVKKIHKIAMEKAEEGAFLVVIGNPVHPEVEGIMGWAGEDAAVISTAEEAEHLTVPEDRKICVVAQTTFNYNKFKELVEIISKRRYDISVLNTICSATKERQTETARIADRVDAMIVIGDKRSSNTQKLFEICKNACNNTYYIQTLDDLNVNQLRSVETVGITAGASTPNNIIEEVQNYVRINF